MVLEEDTYNTIFKAMQNPIRRRILRMIGEKPATYTEIQTELNIDNGLLNYHLDALSSLITKDREDKYTLSDFGRATTVLIKGVEEPSKHPARTPSPPLIKWVTAILLITLAVSGLGILELNNRYAELSDQYQTQLTEKLKIAASLDSARQTINKLNATLITLGKNPLVKASTMLIDSVGLDYFNKYFHDPTVKSPYISGNDTSVTFKYRIEVGNYNVDQNVSFYFTKDYVLAYGIPTKDNLQPYRITADEARHLAVEAGFIEGQWGTQAEITAQFNIDYGTQVYAEKYLWQVVSYLDPPWARTREYVYALVDPISGEVYKINGRGGVSYTESQVDTAEKAAALGIDGYVKVEYPKLPDQIQIVRGGNYTFMFTVKYISYNSIKSSVKLYVDPLYRDPYEIQSNTVDRLRSLLTFKPMGNLTLKLGEKVDITVTFRAPDNGDLVFSFPKWALNGLGLGTDNTLIISDFG